jgi:hypothetical protein
MLGLGRRLACSLGVALLASGTAFAHPGHGPGGGDFSLPHYLTEPEHLFFVLPALVVAVFGGSVSRMLSRRRASSKSRV